MTSLAPQKRNLDRRRHTRFETRFDVELRTPNQAPASYQIRDYCSEGVFVTALQAPTLTVAAGDVVELYRAKSPAVRIQIKVVRLTGNGFGAVFQASQTGNVDLLRLLNGNAPSSDGRAHPTVARDATQWSALIRHLTDRFAAQRLEAVFSSMLQRSIDSIQDRLHQIPTNQVYQETIHDIGKLQQARKNVARTLVVPLLIRIENNASRSSSVTQDERDDAELSLVDIKLFEHWLEAAKVATRLEDQFKAPLQLIEKRVARFFPQSGSASSPASPFNPRQFTDFLNEFTEQEEFGDFARTEFFLSARDILSKRLGSFYDTLAKSLADTAAPERQDAAPAAVDSGTDGPTGESDDDFDAASEPDRDIGQSVEASSDAIPADTARRLAQLLTQNIGNPEFKSALQQELQAQNLPKYLASKTEQRSALASDLLHSVTAADIRMADTAQNWIHSLQPSIAETMIHDPAFMQQRTNPLRALLDELDHLGALLPASDQRDGEQRAALTVEALLNKTLSDAGTVPEKFANTLTHVQQLSNRMSRRYQRNVERVVATSTGRYRLKQAQRMVGEELNRRYTGHRVPEIVPRLLENCWYAFLTLDTLRQGEQNIGSGQPWHTLEALIQLLHGEPSRHLDPLPDPHDLFAQLEKGLEDASFDPLERDNFVIELHELVLGPGAASHRVQMFNPYDLATPTAARPSNDISDADWTDLLNTIDALQVGDAALLHADGQSPQQVRLAWKSGDGEDFALVDQRGIRALEANREELARQIHSDTLELTTTDQRALSKRVVDDLLFRLEDRLGKQKTQDTLTGLLNRGSFKPLLEHALTVPADGKRPVLVWIEIEKLKMISSSLGFEAGDFILVRTARLLRQVFSESDKLAYLGGDQFAALIFGNSAADATALADSFCAQLSARPVTWKDTKLPICAGVGIVDLTEVTGDVPHLIGLASKSVAISRRIGCNRAHRYVVDEPDTSQSSDSMESLIYVNQILEHGRLRLRAQKIAHTEDVAAPAHHYEILLGVHDEHGDMVNIGHFIAAAEAHNLMGQIDRWVTAEAIGWVGTSDNVATLLGGIAINLSGQTMNDRSFVAFVRDLLDEHGVPPAVVSFEVTETAAIGSFADARAIVQSLKNMGCRCALDDFGTGLSSYEYLRELPVDYLKIDGSFVKNIANNENDYAVVRSINEIGQLMGKQTIAEYAINADVLECLRTIGVDYAQGFGIHEPQYLDQLV